MPISHIKTVTIADGANTDIVRPSDWNSAHSVTMASDELIKYLSAGTTSMSSGQYVQFGNGNGVSFGLSVNAGSGTITGSHNALTSQSNQAFSADGGSSAFQTLSFLNANGASFSNNGGGVQLSYTVPSVPAQTVESNTLGMSNLGNTSGTTGVVSGGQIRYVFAGGNNITLSQSLNGVSGTVTISAFNQSVQPMSFTLTGNTASDTTVSGNNIIISGGANVTVFATNNSIGISAAPGGGGGAFSAGVSGGNTAGDTGATGTRVVFAGGNNVTLSQATDANGATITVSGANTVAQTNQSVGLYGVGNTTQNSSTTLDARTLSFGGRGDITVGFSNGTVQISGSQSAQTQSLIAGVYDGANSISTGTIRFTNANGVSFSINGQTLSASVAAQSVQTQSLIAALYDGANSISTGTVRLSNSNGISFGINGQTLTASHNGLTSQSNQNVTAGNGGFAFQTLSFSNANGVSFGTSAGSAITASHNAITSQTNQTLGLYAVSNTTGQSSSTTVDARTLSFHGAGIASVGYSGGSVVISVPSGGGAGDGVVSLGMSTEGNTAGTTGTVSSGRYIMVGSGPISLSQSLNGQSGTLSILGPATSSLSATGIVSISVNGSTISIGAASLGAYAVSNTTQSSSGTVDGRSISFHGAGGVSVGVSNGSVVISGATGGGGGGGTATMWQPFNEGVNVLGQRGNASWAIAPLPTPPTAAGGIVSIDRVCFPILFSNSSNSTGTATVSISFGMYTKNGASLSLAHSTTGTLDVTYSGTVNNSTYAGIRLMTVPWTTTFGDDRYYVAVATRTTTGGTNCTISQVLISQMNSNFSGLFGQNSNRSNQWPVGWGNFSASSTGFPNPMPISQIDGTASLAARPPSWFMINGTV